MKGRTMSKTTSEPAQAKRIRKPDAELIALARVDRVLQSLDTDAAARVLSWINSRYQTKLVHVGNGLATETPGIMGVTRNVTGG